MKSPFTVAAASIAALTVCLSATSALTAPPPAPPPALDSATSAELQQLLAVQANQRVVVFANHQPPRAPSNTFDRLFMWNEVALDTTAIDHTPLQPGEIRVFGEQFGPARSSRAMAVANIAMFEAENALTQRFHSLAGVAPVSGDISIDYAIAQSMHDALVYLYPSQRERLDAILAVDAARMPGDAAGLAAGRALGMTAASAVVALRDHDGSQRPDPKEGGKFTPIGGLGHWSIDPVSKLKVYLGAYWGAVTPFTLEAGDQFRPKPPPELTSKQYSDAFKQVKHKGGDPKNATPTNRTKAETMDGIFWSYDGTPALCAPPRLYNQVARTIALEHGMSSVSEAGRFFAVINTAMADAAIAAWDSKWHYQFWRPVTAIRSTVPAGNPNIEPDPTWYPLGAQATNTRGPNFTPPFPAYVSGHATIGGALFEILRHYYPDASPFTFVSDEYNGMNSNNLGKILPLRPVTYQTFTAAEYANAESRIYLGVHWQFDADEGIKLGHKVGDWAWDHAFRPAAH